MKSLSCKDMGVNDCDFIARGENETEIIDKMINHASASHPDKIKASESGQSMEKIKEEMESKIRND